MGCKNSKERIVVDGFVHGHPSESFPYDEMKKCTDRDNGLLFRLIDTKNNRWAFYNDTRKYEFHVTVFFSPQCRVEALGDTTLVMDPNDGRLVAKAIVYPGLTEPFVQGEVNGFDAEYQTVVLTDEYKNKMAAKKKEKREVTDDDLEVQ